MTSHIDTVKPHPTYGVLLCLSLAAGMGVFEYFQLAEALEAEPIWVINNGIAHEDSIAAANIWPLVQVRLMLLRALISGSQRLVT